MDQAPGNPSSNQLDAGVSADQVRSAVDRSGYPLQTIVSGILRHPFSVQNEWSYVDRDSGELRSIDLRAELRLFEWEPQPRVRPHLTLLTECKQSQLPYIFFESESPRGLLDHPKVFGLRRPTIKITTDDDASTFTFTTIHALNLHEHAFQLAPVYCSTFSKCVRKGAEVELSGTEAYGGLVLPLIKALEHLAKAEAPSETAWYFDAHLSIGLGVLDAPMVVARSDSNGTKLQLAPWVRVLRHEYSAENERFNRDQFWAIDVVHRDYIEVYIGSHVVPFAKEFANRVLRHTNELATGQAFALGMGANCWNDIEQRLRPKQVDASIKRTWAVSRNFFKLIGLRVNK